MDARPARTPGARQLLCPLLYQLHPDLPHIKSWYAKYSGNGFLVVGVHTPEFEIEKSRGALAAAASRFGLIYPIAEDNQSATWNAWGNQYWPAEYLVDQSGGIVHSHFGEGGYAETEARIQSLIR